MKNTLSSLFIPDRYPFEDRGAFSLCSSPAESIDTSLESALRTPGDGDSLHAPIWDTHMRRQKSSDRLSTLSGKFVSAQSSPSIYDSDPFVISGNKTPSHVAFTPLADEEFTLAKPALINSLTKGHQAELYKSMAFAQSLPNIPDEGELSDYEPSSESDHSNEGADTIKTVQVEIEKPLPTPVKHELPPIPIVQGKVDENAKSLPLVPEAPHVPLKSVVSKIPRHVSTRQRDSLTSVLSFAVVYDPDTNDVTTFRGPLLESSTRHAKSASDGDTPAGVQAPYKTGRHYLPSCTPTASRFMAPRTPAATPIKFAGKRSTSLPVTPKAFLRPKAPKRSASEPDPRTENAVVPGINSPIYNVGGVFDEYDKSMNRRFAIVDDEGFFENPSLFPPQEVDEDMLGHDDCEPHLPCRFSTSTTSTSNYVEIDFPPEDSVRQFARESLSKHSKVKDLQRKVSTSNRTSGYNPSSSTFVDTIHNSPTKSNRSKKHNIVHAASPLFSKHASLSSSSMSPLRSQSPKGEKRPQKLPSLFGKLKRSSKYEQDDLDNLEFMTVIIERDSDEAVLSH